MMYLLGENPYIIGEIWRYTKKFWYRVVFEYMERQ